MDPGHGPKGSDNGLESSSDLAFFSLNYDEALRTAGRAVADAWSQARVASAPGLAVGPAERFELSTPCSVHPCQVDLHRLANNLH